MNNGKIVESGETKTVLRTPQHDYTKKLLNAVPRLHKTV
jgi:oligopeptide/dipeptide ABC transporter ATP-binding protein